MATNDGGPAFTGQLRDWFAGMALAGVCHAAISDVGLIAIRRVAEENKIDVTTQLARMAYQIADAMLKEREARK